MATIMGIHDITHQQYEYGLGGWKPSDFFRVSCECSQWGRPQHHPNAVIVLRETNGLGVPSLLWRSWLQMPQPITHLWWRLVAELRLVNGDFSSLARKIHPLQTVLQLSFNLDLSILNTTFHVFTVSFPIFNCKNMQFPQVSDVFLYHNCKSKNDCTPVGLPKHTVHSVVCSVTVRWRIFPWCISTCCLVFNHHCIVQVKEG